MSRWLERFEDAPMPYQDWQPFNQTDVVEVENKYGEARTGLVSNFWWGYETEMGQTGEGVICRVRRIARAKTE